MVRPRDWAARHDARRNAGIPTVSVFLGPYAAARDALERCKQDFIWMKGEPATPEVWVRTWNEARAPSVFAAARTECARALGLSVDALGTAHGALARAALEDRFSARMRGAARALLADPPAPPSPALLPGVLALYPAAAMRGLALHAEALDEVGPALMRLAERAPALPLALRTSSSAWHAWRTEAPERPRVLLEEGLVHLEPGETAEDAGLAPPEGETDPRGPSRTLRALDALGAPETTRRLAEALTEADPGAPEARSLAERLLFEALELDPRTQGCFGLNQSLPIRFGPRDVEVDLLCRRHRVALEVDGYYHFRAPEDFRRDRHKDVLLQQAGWLVARVLAEDVGRRLDEVLEFVRAALEGREPEPDDDA